MKNGLNYVDETNTGQIRLTDQMVDQIVLMQIAVQLFGRKCKDGLAVAWWMEHCSNHSCEQECFPFTEMIAPRLYRQ